MAYMNQDKKAKIAAALKRVMPKGWKYSLAVRHHSTIVLTISEAPIDLIRAFEGYSEPEKRTYADVNPYHYRRQFSEKAVADIFDKIFAVLNMDNYDNSDSMTDYFDVGHYVDVNIGRWNKPFKFTA